MGRLFVHRTAELRLVAKRLIQCGNWMAQLPSGGVDTHPMLAPELNEIAVWSRTLVGTSPDVDRDAYRAALATAERQLLATSQLDGSRILSLTSAFGLSKTEQKVLWLLIGAELDPAVAVTLRTRFREPGISTRILREMIYGADGFVAALDELSAEGSLRRLALIERSDAGGGDVGESAYCWTIARSILRWTGSGTLVPGSIAASITMPETQADLSSLALHADVVVSLRRAIREPNRIILAVGSTGLGRRTALSAVAAEAGFKLLSVQCSMLPTDESQLRYHLKLIVRDCRLLRRAPLLCNIDRLCDEKHQTRVDTIGTELVSQLDGPIFVTCGPQRPLMRWGRPSTLIEFKAPTSGQRAQLWLDALGQGTRDDAEFLATQYPLAPALIRSAADGARAHSEGTKMRPEDIYAGVRAILDDRLGDYAKRVEVTQTWDDLVLPAEQMEAVQYLIARIRQRRTVYETWGFAAKVGKGLGTGALFSGPPGTGKTMVAALIAKELGLELYQVDMAKISSKWIGETERNLAALFDAAEAGHAVLLFDEADSLFGKRTEVKSSNDRYANLETNYLLQRLESFTGICLLTSNHENAIDPAFMRRLSIHVRFDVPEADERERLWRAVMPADAPAADDCDFARLGQRFAMSGGYIKNAVLRAAFMAADEGCVITNRHLHAAAKLEYEGMGKIAA